MMNKTWCTKCGAAALKWWWTFGSLDGCYIFIYFKKIFIGHYVVWAPVVGCFSASEMTYIVSSGALNSTHYYYLSDVLLLAHHLVIYMMQMQRSMQNSCLTLMQYCCCNMNSKTFPASKKKLGGCVVVSRFFSLLLQHLAFTHTAVIEISLILLMGMSISLKM